MVKRRFIEITVGIFMLLGILALFLLALRVSGFDPLFAHRAIKITAVFDNIGDLKVRAPVKIAGVYIGEVSAIKLEKDSYRARVFMLIDENRSNIPNDSAASILSDSLLGSNYVNISPGFADDYIKAGEEITETHPAIILENLIGQALFTPKPDENKNKNKKK